MFNISHPFVIEYWIILFIIILIYYHYADTSNGPDVNGDISATSTNNIMENYVTPFTLPSIASQNLVNTECTAIDFHQNVPVTLPNYGNFGIIGKYPPSPVCDSCELDFDCSGYPFGVPSDSAMNVCRRCQPKSGNSGKNQKYVFARSTGRPRQCRKV